MNTEVYTVYVFLLKNGWRFLYPKNRNIEVGSVSDLMTEFQYSCELFGDDYRAVELLRTHNDVASYNINGLVLHYMHIYGVEHVRGGKYFKTALSFENKNEISDMIKYFSDELQEQEEKTNRFHTYVTEYSELNNDQMWKERNKIDKILLSYHKTKNQCEKLKSVRGGYFGNHEWLKQICDNPSSVEGHFITIDLMHTTSKIQEVYYLYGTHFENADETIESLKKKHPCAKNINFLTNFTTFFERIILDHDEYYRTFLPYIFDVIDLTYYSIINRIEELEFDCRQINYTENVERNHALTVLLLPKEVSKRLTEQL